MLIFVDTSVLGYVYELFPSARNELIDWFRALVAGGRLRIPAWVASEYFGRVSEDRLDDYAPDFDEVKNLPEALERQLRVAQLSLDAKSAKSGGAAQNRDKFISEMTSFGSVLLEESRGRPPLAAVWRL